MRPPHPTADMTARVLRNPGATGMVWGGAKHWMGCIWGGGGIASQVSSPDEIPTADFTAAALDVAGPDRAAGYPVEAAHGRAVSRRPLNAPLALKEGVGCRPAPSFAEATT
jgi:hypothetical protein